MTTPDRQTERWTLIATILGSSAAFISSSTVNVALPALQAGLGASALEISWIVNIFLLLLAALIMLGGSLGDHFGRKRIYLIGVIIFGISSIAAGLAPTTLTLIIARGAQGLGGALLVPGSLAIISAVFSAERRGQAIGVWSGFTAITTAAGPVLGGWLVDNLSWRWTFFVILPQLVAVVFVVWRFVPESRAEKASAKLDYLGAVLITLSLFCITFGFLESSRRGFGDVLVWGSLLVGVGLLVGFVVQEERSAEPMVPLDLFRSSTFAGANLVTLILWAALGGVLFLLPQNLIQIQAYSATAAGAAILPFVLLISLLSSRMGRLADRIGARLPLTIGPVVGGSGFLLLAVFEQPASYWTSYFIAMVLFGLGMAITIAPLTTIVMNAVPTEQSGIASGINNAASRIAQLLGVALLTIVTLLMFNRTLDQQLPLLALSAEQLAFMHTQRINLAGAQLPEGVSAETAIQLRNIINAGFLAGFRLSMLLAGILAASGGVAAWFMIDSRN